MNPGYYIIPGGIDFNFTFSFLVWFKAFNFAPWSRILDCGKDKASDNIIVALSNSNPYKPYAEIYQGSSLSGTIISSDNLPTNNWFHLAIVYNGQRLLMYVNGTIVANSAMNGPNILNRTKCYNYL